MHRWPALLVSTAFLAAGSSALAGPGEDLIAAEKCNKCHTEKTTKKGPSFASLVEKYKGKPDTANRFFLVLKNGGKVGDEDDHKKVAASDADLKAAVAVILASK